MGFINPGNIIYIYILNGSYPLQLARLAWRVRAESWEAKIWKEICVSILYVDYVRYFVRFLLNSLHLASCHLEGVEWIHFKLKWANNPCQRWRVCESLPVFEPPSTCKWKKWRLMVTHAVFVCMSYRTTNQKKSPISIQATWSYMIYIHSCNKMT